MYKISKMVAGKMIFIFIGKVILIRRCFSDFLVIVIITIRIVKEREIFKIRICLDLWFVLVIGVIIFIRVTVDLLRWVRIK